MLRFAHIALENPSRPDLPPILVQAVITREDFRLAVHPQIAERLALAEVGQQQVIEGTTPVMRPLMGPLRLHYDRRGYLSAALTCSSGVVIGEALAALMGLNTPPLFGVVPPVPAAPEPTPVPGAQDSGQLPPSPQASPKIEDELYTEEGRPLVHPQLIGSRKEQVRIFRHFLDDASCERFCKEMESIFQKDPVVPAHARSAYMSRLPRFDEEVRDMFYRVLSEKVEPQYGISIDWWEGVQFLRYAKGGKYNTHFDSHNTPRRAPGEENIRRKVHDRDISVILYLNDNFVGGDLYFPDLDLRIKPERGMLVTFPSHPGYAHAAEPVKEGIRYAAVTWTSVKDVVKVREKAHAASTHMDAERARRGNAPEAPKPVAVAPAPAAAIPSWMPKIVPMGHSEYTDRILQVEQALSEEECKTLYDFAAGQSRKPSTIVGGKVDTEIRSAFFVERQSALPQLNKTLARLIKQHIEPFYNMQVECWEKPDMLWYEPGGQYKAHIDGEMWKKTEEGGHWKRILDRDISILLYLNGDFTGGALSFPDYKLKIQPKPGLLVAFPSGHHYLHRAEPVESGHRLAIVSWATCFGTPRVRKDLAERAVFMKDITL